jgi:two-component system nitrogen regulation response regulator GlnG
VADGDALDGPVPASVGPLARRLAEVIPPLVDEFLRTRPGHVHREMLRLLERPLLMHVLSVTGGNQLRAARVLGLNRNTVRKRCRELGVPGATRAGARLRPPESSKLPGPPD